jgi:DNA-binding SARP family transcriptional activator
MFGSVSVAVDTARTRAVGRDDVNAAPTVQSCLRIVGSFELVVDGEGVVLPSTAQRLVAFLALQERSLSRPYVAGTLWPETTDDKAGANLRTALWALKSIARSVVEATSTGVRLGPGVQVDLHDRTMAAQRLLASTGVLGEDELDESSFLTDLLPDWYDDWLVIDRERYHQLRLRVLEAICERLTCIGSFGRAVQVGLAAVAGEPLRETAHRVLMRVHVAEGNHAEAMRQFELYRRLLKDQLGLAPVTPMSEMLNEQSQATPG